MDNVLYSAVILDEFSRKMLIKHFKSIIPEQFEIFVHHMTINLGPIDQKYEKYIGMSITLKVVDIGISDYVIAVGVTGFPSNNIKPHITLAVNKTIGGKPRMSNDIEEWRKIKHPFYITGKVEEVLAQ